MRVFRGILWCATILLAVSVGAMFALSTQNLKFAAPYVEQTLSQYLGHPIKIEGPIRAALLPEGLRLSLDQVSVENVDWGLEPAAGKARHIVIDVKLLPLLDQRVELDRFRVSGATLFLERNDNGAVNWSSLANASGRVSGVKKMDFDQVDIQLYDLSKSGLTKLSVRKLSLTPDEDGVAYKGLLQVAGQPLVFSGRTEGLSQWADKAPARTRNQLRFAGYDFQIDGELLDPRMFSSDLNVVGAAPPDSVMPLLLGFRKGAMPIQARLVIGKNWLEVDDIVLGGAKNSPQANVSMDWIPFERPRLDISVRAESLEIADPESFLGPVDEEAFSQSVNLVSRILRNWDGQLTVAADRLRLADAVFEEFQLDVRALDGRLENSGFETLAAGGYISMPFQVWFEPNLSIAAQPKVKNVRLEHLTEAESRLPLNGVLSLAADLKGEGETPEALLSSLHGQTNLLLGDGALRPSTELDFAADAWAEVWQLFSYGRWDRDELSEPMSLSCVVSRFDFEDGLATANGLLVETSQAATTGAGYVDLRQGLLDFRLSPRPKDPALLADASDLRVAGELDSPTLTPQRDVSAERRGSGGVGTLVLSGGAQSLLPLMEIGHENENVCIRQISGSVSNAASFGAGGAAGNGG